MCADIEVNYITGECDKCGVVSDELLVQKETIECHETTTYQSGAGLLVVCPGCYIPNHRS